MNTRWTENSSPFHDGEREIHARLGISERMDQIGRRVIRSYLPQQHRDFYETLSFLIVGSVDAEGRPWISLLAGAPGFISSPDERSLHIDTAPLFGSPLADLLDCARDNAWDTEAGDSFPVGLLGLIPSNRRRNRITGSLACTRGGGLQLRVDQVFGNCPQYIQARDIEAGSSLCSPAAERPLVEGQDLDEKARAVIAGADTFFIASAYGDRNADSRTGVDASHRGGPPGFVRVQGNTLIFPDFRGNNFFNTLGNIEKTGVAGLLFIDFDSGDLLYLSGRATVLWDDPRSAQFDVAQRLVQIVVDRWRRVEGSLPLKFLFRGFAPGLLDLGNWDAVAGG